MLVLVDTSVWIDHLRSASDALRALLLSDRVATHDHIVGELAMGSLRDRSAVLDSLLDLPRAPLAEESDVRRLIESREIYARGIGYTDAHLLAAVLLDANLSLWTHDRRLAEIASVIGVKCTTP